MVSHGFLKLINTLGVAVPTHQRWPLGDEGEANEEIWGCLRSAPLPSYLIEAQRRAQYCGGFAFVRQVENAHKKEAAPGGQLLGSGARVSGLNFFFKRMNRLVWSRL